MVPYFSDTVYISGSQLVRRDPKVGCGNTLCESRAFPTKGLKHYLSLGLSLCSLPVGLDSFGVIVAPKTGLNLGKIGLKMEKNKTKIGLNIC